MLAWRSRHAATGSKVNKHVHYVNKSPKVAISRVQISTAAATSTQSSLAISCVHGGAELVLLQRHLRTLCANRSKENLPIEVTNNKQCYSPHLCYAQYQFIKEFILRLQSATPIENRVLLDEVQTPRSLATQTKRRPWKLQRPIEALSVALLTASLSLPLSGYSLDPHPTLLQAAGVDALHPSALNDYLKQQEATSIPPVTVEKLHVTEVGEGDTYVVLLHGLGNNHTYWNDLLSHMNLRKYRYVMPDLLGHGQSSSVPHLRYTLDTHLYFIERDVISKLGCNKGTGFARAELPLHNDAGKDDDPLISNPQSQKNFDPPTPGNSQKGFHIIGHGLGSILALELASRMPHRTLSVTLISLPYYEDEKQATTDLVMKWTPKPFHPVLTRLSPSISLNSIIELARPMHFVYTDKYEFLHAICSTFEECIIHHRLDNAASHLARIGTVPIDILHGTDDTVVDLERSQSFFCKYFQVSRLDVVNGGGHDLPKTHSKDIAHHILSVIE